MTRRSRRHHAVAVSHGGASACPGRAASLTFSMLFPGSTRWSERHRPGPRPTRTPPAAGSGLSGPAVFHTGYQRDRKHQPPAAQGSQDPRPIPHRRRRPQDPLFGRLRHRDLSLTAVGESPLGESACALQEHHPTLPSGRPPAGVDALAVGLTALACVMARLFGSACRAGNRTAHCSAPTREAAGRRSRGGGRMYLSSARAGDAGLDRSVGGRGMRVPGTSWPSAPSA